LAHELEATRQTQEERAAAAAQEQAALQGELQRLSAERERLETAQAQRSGESDTQRARLDQLQASVDRAQADRDRARADAEEAGRRIEQMHARVDELAELAQQRDGALHSALDERARFEEAARMAEAIAAELANERDDLRRKAQDAESEIERERASHNAEIEALARDLAHAHESQQPGARSSESLAGDAEAPLDSDEPPVPRFQGPLVIERSAPLGAIMENPAEAPLPPAEEPAPALPASQVQSSGELILLDDGASLDAASTALRGAGIEISVAAPTEATVDALARRKVKCVMLNLGCGPAAWRTLKTLRERVGTRHVPVLAYVMTADAPAGFCFGRADFALWPIEPGRLVERLARLRPKLRRLLAVSADIDGMGRLREPLAQAHVSTSVVLDAKQALEFAAMVDPEAAMLHLSPSCPSAARAIVGLRSSEATRELPLLVLLDKSAGSGEDAFFGVTIRQLVGKAGFQLSSLPEEIARVIG